MERKLKMVNVWLVGMLGVMRAQCMYNIYLLTCTMFLLCNNAQRLTPGKGKRLSYLAIL